MSHAAPARVATFVASLIALVAATAGHAATTTYSSATSLSSIAVGDTAVLINGGSLTAGLLTNSGTLQFDLSNDLTVTTQLNGNGAFVKTNSGTVTLDQTNGYTGPTYITAGTLLTGINAGDQGLGNSQQLFFAGTSGMLKYGDNSTQFASGITLAGTGALANSASTMNVTGKITGTGVLNLFSSGSALVAPTSVTISSPLTLTPSVASDFIGTINVLQGLVTPGNANNPFGDVGNVIVLNGGGLAWPNGGGTSVTVSNPITLAAGGGQVAARASGPTGELNINSVISGTGTLTRVGGRVNLFGANTFTGDTYLGTTTAGSIQLGNVDALAGSTIDRPPTEQRGRLQFTGTVSSGTAFVNIGGIKGSASLGGQSGDNVNLSFGGNNQSTTFTGTLGWLDFEQSGYYNIFRKAGTGTLTLTADNRAQSGVVLANGVLAVNSDRALGVGTGLDTNADPTPAVNSQPVVMTGGTLQLTTLFTMPRAITLQTGGGGLDTSLLPGTSAPNFPGSITGTAGLSIWANGSITGTSAGATVLTGTNTYVGTTTILAGVVTATSNFGTASNTVALNGGGLLAAGGARTNAYAVSLGAGHGWLRAAAAGDTLNQNATISGAGNLLSSGSGVVNLTVATTNTGDVRIVEGTLNAANVNALQNATLDMNAADTGTIGFTVAGNTTYAIGGLKGSRNIDNTGDTLSVGGNNQSTTYSGDLSGAGGFTKVGSGDLTLSGTNNYSGGTVVSAGSLIGTTSSLQGAITNNAAVEFAQGTSGTYAGAMTGSGAVTKSGGGSVRLSGTNNYSGGTTVSAGRLVGTTSSIQGSIINAAEVEFAQVTSGTYSGAMTGSGGLIKSGNGAVTMTGASSYGGTTDVQAGTLVVNANNIGVTAPIAIASGATLAGSGTHGGAIVVNAGATLSPGNSPGTFTAASGTWAGGGNYNWQLYDAAGTAGTHWDLLDLSGVLDITATSGTPFKVNLWTLSGTGPDVNGSATNFNSNGNYSWRIATAAGGVTGFAADRFQVNTSGTNGTAGFANSFGSGQFSVGNTGNDVNVVFTPAIVFDVTSGTQTQTQQGASANIPAAVSVTKTGTGTVILDGDNTYSAATTVSAGTLLVTGTLANSAVSVASGATLAGDGRVGQTVTVSGSGVISPGAAPTGIGTLELGGLSLSPTSRTLLGVSGTSPGVTYDQVSILGGGPLTYGGVLDLSTSNIDGAPNGTSYRLFDFTGTPSNSFASLTPLGGEYAAITWSGPVGGVWTSTNGSGGSYLTFTEGTGTLAVVPEPGALALAAIGGIGCWLAARRKRRTAHSR